MESALINESQRTSSIGSKTKKLSRMLCLLFFQPPLLTSDLLTGQEVTRSKEVTLSGGNELVRSSLVGLRVMAFEEVS